MTSLTALFALRVAGQAVQLWIPQPYLPAFDEFQGSNLGYPTLLTAQLLILVLMLGACLRVGFGLSVPNAGLGRGLAWLGGLYMAGSVARIVVGLALPAAPAWFWAWIPGFFHLVLAGFVLTLAHYHARPSRQSAIEVAQ
jgi:hypothetical protein